MQDTRDMGSMQPEIRMSHRSAGEAVMYVHGHPKNYLSVWDSACLTSMEIER